MLWFSVSVNSLWTTSALTFCSRNASRKCSACAIVEQKATVDRSEAFSFQCRTISAFTARLSMMASTWDMLYSLPMVSTFESWSPRPMSMVNALGFTRFPAPMSSPMEILSPMLSKNAVRDFLSPRSGVAVSPRSTPSGERRRNSPRMRP